MHMRTQATLYCLLLLAAGLFACNSGRQNNTPAADTGRTAVTALPDFPGENTAIPDTQFIVVDSMVNIRVNDSPVPRQPGAFHSTLAAYWLQCYQSSQKLPAFLSFKYQGTVMMGARGNIMDDVQHAQDSVKEHIAQQTYRQPFSALTASQQEQLRKDFPVLFQKQF